MVLLRFWLPWVLVLAAFVPRCGLAAASAETGAFDAAAKAFQDRFYSRAESEFGEFILRFTNSARLPEALLFQAEARIMQTNHPGAIELLTAGLPKARNWADEYLFWLAEALLRNGDYAKAGEHFATLIGQFPSSPRRLEAALGEVDARSKLGQWPRVIELLQQTNGVFQIAARANATNELALRGYLLLSEAHLAQNEPTAAAEALQHVIGLPLGPRLAWQRQHLACRIQLAQGNLDQAVEGVTNLLTLATNTSDQVLLAESISFQAGLLERLGSLDEAMNTYEKNLADGFPADRQREALLKIAELALARNRIVDAARVLQRFCAQDRQTPSREQALLTLGELRLRQYLIDSTKTVGPALSPATNGLAGGTNGPPSTNHLQQAQAAFDTLAKDYPQSPLRGKAHLSLGWCYWLQDLPDSMPLAQAAFQEAVKLLPESPEHATALFKLGDTLFRQNNPAGALTNYSALLRQHEKAPKVREDLFEPALYQSVRAAIAAGKMETATDALGKILDWFPTGFYTERAVLIAGQAVTSQGAPAKARQIYQDFAQRSPESPLLPEVYLAIARTYEQQGSWGLVIAEYDAWLSRFTNSPARPRAEYLRAWANFQDGRETNAFIQFTNFIARFPKDDYTPLARWWVADYNFRNGKWQEAEENFQLLQSTNWPRSKLSYQAQLMAGRTALARQGWRDAERYFTNLTSDVKCPPDVWAQAALAYGNMVILQDSTNKLADYALAVSVYNSVIDRVPTNPVAVLALGEKASCLLQWAQTQTTPQYDAAAAEFQKVITNQLADAAVRGIARVGIGVVLEKQAQQKSGSDQQALLRRALDSYLDVFYYDKDLKEGERPDMFWVKKAGLEAARVAESLQDWGQAIKVYDRLNELLPALRPGFDKKRAKAAENLARAKS